MKPHFIKCKNELMPNENHSNSPLNINLVTCFKRDAVAGVSGIKFYFIDKTDTMRWIYDTKEERDVEYMRLLNDFCL